MKASEFRDVISKLERRGIMPESAPDLDRMKEALSRSGFFDWPFWKSHGGDPGRVIVVAGTNGKGSTCAVLEALLRDSGAKTGFYSSPHLVDYTERIRFNGAPISRALFTEAYERVVACADEMALTHFETLTLMALWVFCSGEAGPVVDRLILEVGLGGLWDATNAVPHGTAVIAKLGLDHINLLGPTLDHIARNKLGVVPEQGLVVHQKFPAEALAAVGEVKTKTRCRWVESPECGLTAFPGHPPRFEITTPWGRSPTALAGRRGGENATLALKVFEQIGFDPSRHLRVLSAVNWPGRMELISKTRAGTPVYFSGDHNPQGIDSLIDLLPAYPRGRLVVVCGIGKDKDRRSILDKLFGLGNAEIHLTETPFKSCALEDYGPWLKRAKSASKNPREALEAAAAAAGPEDMILVTGSLYLMEALGSPPGTPNGPEPIA